MDFLDVSKREIIQVFELKTNVICCFEYQKLLALAQCRIISGFPALLVTRYICARKM